MTIGKDCPDAKSPGVRQFEILDISVNRFHLREICSDHRLALIEDISRFGHFGKLYWTRVR
ncbi:MAG: hypothetical protein ACI4D8_04270 [Wujia sp.]